MEICDLTIIRSSEKIGTTCTREEGRKWKEQTQGGFRALCKMQRSSLIGPNAETFDTIINAVVKPTR